MTDLTPRTEATPPPRRGQAPRRQWLILAVVGVAAVAVFLLVPVVGQLFAPKVPPAAPAPPPGTFRATPEQWASLGFAAARTTDFLPGETTEGNIAVDDNRTTAVYSPYTGHVTRVFAQVGNHVRKGAPLFAVDAAELVQGESDLLTAAAQVKQTQAALTRLESLLQGNGAAVKDVDQARTDYVTAKAALEAARGRLFVLGQTPAQADALATGAQRRGITADVMVVSPISGVVTQRAVGVGQNLASLANNGGGTPLFSISDLSVVWLVGDLREADVPTARVGDMAAVTVGALPGRVFHARVDFVSPMVDPTTRRVTVRAQIANPDGLLRPQMFARFGLITGPPRAVVAVPAEAVIYEAEAARVWVAKPGRLLELRQIRAGATRDGLVEVVSGLAPGETVVTSGSLFIDRASQGT